MRLPFRPCQGSCYGLNGPKTTNQSYVHFPKFHFTLSGHFTRSRTIQEFLKKKLNYRIKQKESRDITKQGKSMLVCNPLFQRRNWMISINFMTLCLTFSSGNNLNQTDDARIGIVQDLTVSDFYVSVSPLEQRKQRGKMLQRFRTKPISDKPAKSLAQKCISTPCKRQIAL